MDSPPSDAEDQDAEDQDGLGEKGGTAKASGANSKDAARSSSSIFGNKFTTRDAKSTTRTKIYAKINPETKFPTTSHFLIKYAQIYMASGIFNSCYSSNCLASCPSFSPNQAMAYRFVPDFVHLLNLPYFGSALRCFFIQPQKHI